MTPAERLVSRGRRGEFLAVLPALLDLAADRDGDPGEAWVAGAAAIRILFWCDRFTEAADLAETLIADTAPAGGEICDQDPPLIPALLAAQVHAGTDARPRLQAALAAVPEGRVLHRDLLTVLQLLDQRPILELLSNVGDFGGEVKPLDGVIGAEYVSRDYAGLTARWRRVVWQALHTANDFPRARALVESSGEYPEQFLICLWLAGWFAATGEIERGEEALFAAHARWWPFATWDAIPDPMVLHPTLRAVCTDRVRTYYLTTPIGPEADKATQP